MENLKTIKNRVSAVGSIIKAMNSMKMVATVKLAKINNTHTQAKRCAGILLDMLGKAAKEHILCNRVESNSWTRRVFSGPASLGGGADGSESSALIVVLSADQGFCGPFNQHVLHSASELIELYNNAYVEIFGKIGEAAIASRRPQFAEFNRCPDIQPAPEFAKYLSDLVIRYVVDHGVTTVLVVSGKFENVLTQKAQISTIFPIEAKPCDSEIVEIEDCSEVFMTDLLNAYLYEAFICVITEHLISEFSARVMAMDASVKNADDMFDELRIKRNKIRQDKITQELTEIVSSIECMM
ncbi:MAG: F0F1 ATP synthase subunit gamma [Holosporales bacterium]|jgi:F-type H+-transporting ATPase subunit gamma|nr:F0F1 ATP synthase subunit gamma [Holosporales bacterium]